MAEARAVAIVHAHLEAWTNHDLESTRGNLAEEVQFHSQAANTVGIAGYMSFSVPRPNRADHRYLARHLPQLDQS